MLRLFGRTTRRSIRLPYRRNLSSTSPRNNNHNTDNNIPENSANLINNIQNPRYVASTPSSSSPPPILHPHPQSNSSPNLNRVPIIALSATVVSAMLASCYVMIKNDDESSAATSARREIESAIEKSNESFRKIMHRMKHTGAAASVLWQSLRSVMSSANHEVRTGFEWRVAALLADISQASESRRAAIVGAGGGAVVDWLLETVAVASGDNLGTQAESARALAYLIADPKVCEAVVARPHAVPNLLRFIFSAQPRKNVSILLLMVYNLIFEVHESKCIEVILVEVLKH